MWVTLIRAAFALGIFAVLMVALDAILSPLVGFATSGPNSDHQTVGQLETMFSVMTVENLTLLAGVAVMLFLIWRATLEGRGA